MTSKKKNKFIFITGGVVSSLGKGITASSIACLIEARGFRVTNIKMDPYINIDPGTMNPYQHGEVYVTEDGAECDLDLGHYERFTSSTMTANNNITTGKVYQSVIERERRGDYLGKTVQVIPHITDEIKNRIILAAKESDVAIVEVGGTVGDIESQPFLEAVRQMKVDMGPQNVCYIHVTLVPFIETVQEMKTKPTQHSVKELRMIGIQPDFIVCRTKAALPQDIKEKIALFCNVIPENVISEIDVKYIYEVPLKLREEGLDDKIADHLNMFAPAPRLDKWKKLIDKLYNPQDIVTIGLVGKYVQVIDAYKSLFEALVHGGIANNLRVETKFIDSENLNEQNYEDHLKNLDGILIPGGFGHRGIKGKILAAKYARENNVPFFGICLGMQIMAIEFLRNKLGCPDANSIEFDEKTRHPVICMMDEQKNITKMGGTMRLGGYKCVLNKKSLAYRCYQKDEIIERHRHRYEFNNEYREKFEKNGIIFSGLSPDSKLVEIMELKGHRFYLGCQFHPEFKSRPLDPHPLFIAFIKASYENKKENRR
ncbi:MAG: CTP synthase [Deltaproteobacteria bacterium]|nr:CTP synthase [Deltaproteobacteria bacterium]